MRCPVHCPIGVFQQLVVDIQLIANLDTEMALAVDTVR
jgi:hypothetical protein